MHVHTQAQYLCVEGHDEDAQVGRGDGQQRRETPGDAATPCQGTHKKGEGEREGEVGFRGRGTKAGGKTHKKGEREKGGIAEVGQVAGGKAGEPRIQRVQVSVTRHSTYPRTTMVP